MRGAAAVGIDAMEMIEGVDRGLNIFNGLIANAWGKRGRNGPPLAPGLRV